MRLLLSAYGSHGSHGGIGPMVALAAQLRAPGAEAPGCAPPDFAELLARVAVVAEGCDSLVACGMMPTGGWR